MKEGSTHLVSSSGGNAGLAAVFCAHELGVPITVVVPETTPSFIAQKMRDEGATVEIVGKVRLWIVCCKAMQKKIFMGLSVCSFFI